MANNKDVNHNIKRHIKEVVHLLGVSQKSIAEKSNIQASTLSDFLKKNKAIRNDSYTNLIKTLNQVFSLKKSDLEPNSNIEIQRLLYCINNNIYKKNPDHPGTLISHDSINYILRSSDNKLDHLMSTEDNQIILLKGGPLMGKSSSIQRIIRLHKNRYNVIHLDFETLCHSCEYITPKMAIGQFLHIVYQEFLVQATKITKSYDIVKEFFPAELYHGIKELIQAQDKPFLLIFDHLDRLYEYIFPNDPNSADQFIQFLGKLRSSFSSPGIENLKIIVALNARSYTSKASDFLRTQAININIVDFSIDQVLFLAETYGIDTIHSKTIWAYYNGHPYLCHGAIWGIASGSSWDQITYKSDESMEYWSMLNKTDNAILNRFNTSIKDIYPMLIDESKFSSLDYQIIDILEMVGVLDNGRIKSPFIANELKRKYQRDES